MKNSVLYSTVTLDVLGLKKKLFVERDSVLKLNSRLSFYYRYLVAEMA